MAVEDIIQNMISQLGQSQEERAPEELQVHFADVDERSTEDLLLFVKNLAPHIRYYPGDGTTTTGDWSTFFSYDNQTLQRLLSNQAANTPPHLALLLAFLELYKKPQEILNQITGRHLDFYFNKVLRLSKKQAIADKAHVLIELKKSVGPLTIGPDNLFSAGKDAAGQELLYAPTRQTIVNTAKVDSVRSVFLDRRGSGLVRYAPIANSADGVGGELPAAEPKWLGFGRPDLPPAEVGFALASPLLRLQEGTRTITLSLKLLQVDPARVTSKTLTGAFEVYLTGPKNWLGPYQISPTLVGNLLEFQVTVPATEKAVANYQASVHGYAYAAQTPILKVFLKADSPHLGFQDLQNLIIQTVQIKVAVSDITSLTLESDGGALNPKKPFFPFGPLPAVGSHFSVGYSEALGKNLTEVSLQVQWQAVPPDLAKYYSDYSVPDLKDNHYFTAAVSFQGLGSRQFYPNRVNLFSKSNASLPQTLTFQVGTPSSVPTPSAGMKVYALHSAARSWTKAAAEKMILKNQFLQPARSAVPESLPGLLMLSLEKDFLSTVYRQKLILFARENKPLHEPYTPVIQNISFGYQANSGEVKISSATLSDFSSDTIQFYHISYFGQMREHAYQRRQFPFLASTSVTLLPTYSHEGELLIGFTSLSPGDSVSVLFQVAEGSANPELPQQQLDWFVLCDNYWKPLSRREVVLDTTNQLLTSGVITFVIPPEATTDNTILPGDRLWLKAAIAQNVTAVCQLIDVAANAVEVQFRHPDTNPQHLLTALPKGRIIKLKNGLPEVKAVHQPFASFGGSPEETEAAFYVRQSERLRHKNRCLSAWDYERLILEAFPNVHRVKCIPHAREGCWLAPGHVLLVVIPDLRNQNAPDPLQPKVDANTMSRITDYVRQHCGLQVQLKVKNPLYQQIKLDFRVKFQPGKEFNYYSRTLEQALIQFLSPWAFTPERDIYFGGKVFKSVLLDFVEDLEYVDYVTDFKMFSFTGTDRNRLDLNAVQANTPDTILVSSQTHTVNPA
jgi:hypothetical protein